MERDVRDLHYGIGYRYSNRVWMVDPSGVITVVTREEWKEIVGITAKEKVLQEIRNRAKIKISQMATEKKGDR